MQLTVRDVAKYLKVSEKTVYRWIHSDALPAYKLNDQFRFNRAELIEWITTKRIQVSPEIFVESESSSAPLPTLVEALEAGGVFYRVEGRDKEAALWSAVKLLRLSEEVDQDYLYQVLVAREKLSSTGIGEGIALPHARSPIVLHVARPSITLCFLEQPVDFNAVDGKPVHALFLLISPTVRAHLHMLARLAYSLRDSGLKAALAGQAGREEIFSSLRRLEAALAPVAAAPAAEPGGAQ